MTGLDSHVVARVGEFVLDVEIAASPGEVLGVLGRNGAGKTTLLRALAGLQPLAEGWIVLDGVALDRRAEGVFVQPEQRAVGFVFQDYLLFPHLSVLDNVGFGIRAAGVSRAEARRRARPYLERVDIAGLAGRKPAELSGGQAQRVALARALARDPRLLLLDEPLAALDANTRLEVRTGLRQHLLSFGGPSLVVTHDALEAMTLADRLLVVEAGRVVQQGETRDVVRHPATAFVARLMGVNLLSGKATSGHVELDGGGALAITDRSLSGRVLVAVRPEVIKVATKDPADPPSNLWRGKIDAITEVGGRISLAIQGEPAIDVEISPALASELRLAIGQPVWLSVAPGDLVAYPDSQAAAGEPALSDSDPSTP
jgi:molybdate transport system ATP-binding protein